MPKIGKVALTEEPEILPMPNPTFATDDDRKEARRLWASIKRIRNARGWSVKKLSRYTGISESALHNLDNGLFYPRLLTIVAVLRVMGLHLTLESLHSRRSR